jgi:hypothetical protein
LYESIIYGFFPKYTLSMYRRMSVPLRHAKTQHGGAQSVVGG